MARHVQIRVEDVRSWRRDPEDIEDGVLIGSVSLRIRGFAVLWYRPCGLNNSALTLARTAMTGHTGVLDDQEALSSQTPLFFCFSGLRNSCGVVSDFTVSHQGGIVFLSDFYGCQVPRETELEVPWEAWATAVVKFGTFVRKRLPPDHAALNADVRAHYLELRDLLHMELRPIRRALRRSTPPNHGAT